MLIRTVKDKNHPYVLINKSFLDDPNLSLAAKGLLAYCMAKPDGWKFYPRQMSKVLKEGRDAIYRLFNELIEQGYLVRKQAKTKEGKFDTNQFNLYETKLKESLPHPDFPDTEVPDTDLPDAYIDKDLVSNKEVSNKEEREGDKPPPRAPVSSKKIQRRENVLISEAEHNELIKVYGRDNTESFYQILQEWKEDTPRSKWKKSDYCSILRWVIAAHSERKQKSTDQGNPKEDSVLAQKIWDRYKSRKERDIELGYKYIEFKNGMTAENLEFGSKDFRKKALEQLKKRRLSIEGL